VAAVITLTTDFGVRDPYVAEMKAAILALLGAVHLIDVTHEVAAHDVAEGALAVEAAAAVFAPGTIHVAVVDPGVGTARRGLVVAAGGQTFIGPDNGLFTSCFAAPGWRAFELAAPEYRRPVVSSTFHGRDVFAPAAAHVALGVPPARFGPPVLDPVRLAWPEPRVVGGGVGGVVIHVDRFGNLVTSIHGTAVDETGGRPVVRVAGRVVPVVRTYGDLPVGGLGALVSSRARLEVVVREGSAAAALRARRGTPILLTRPASRRRPTTRKRRMPEREC
jgi:S-adenosylmethionine hydrolase